MTLRPRFHVYVESVYTAAMITFDNKNSKFADWFKEHIETMASAIEEKKNALAAYKTSPSEQNLQPSQAAGCDEH